jgi:methionyl aminopeptidase
MRSTFPLIQYPLPSGGRGEGRELCTEMFPTNEPMVNAGRAEVNVLDDGWTTVTRDRGL